MAQVAGDAGEAGEGLGDDAHPQVGFAAAVEARLVAGVVVAFVDHGEAFRLEMRAEPVFDRLPHRHRVRLLPVSHQTQENGSTKPATIRFVNSCCDASRAPYFAP